jgi:hypothetical protein
MLDLRSSLLPAVAALALVAGQPACDSRAHTSSPAAPEAPAPQAVAVDVTPTAPTVATGGTVQLAAAVTGTVDTRVTWSVDETSGGTVSSTGLYTAPGTAGSFHVRATSVADTRAFGEAAVTVAAPPPVTPVSVVVTPSPGAVDGCKTLQLTATVSNATNTAVTWNVQEGVAGGTVSTSGLYTAPATAGTYHVVATSVQDTTKTYVVTVTVSDHVLSVTVSPSTVTLQPGQTQQFTATVTTTCGATVSTQSVTAPL